MQLYQMHEAEFVLPGVTQDNSVNLFGFYNPDGSAALSPPGTQPPEFSLVISRESVPESEVTEDYVNRQMQVLEQQLGGFQLQSRLNTYVDALYAILCQYTWDSEYGRMHQRQTFIICPPATTLVPVTRMALTISGTTREALAERYEALYSNLLYSFTFRR